MKHLPAIRLIGSGVQLGLFLLLLINGVLFRHSHRLEGRGIITHAHPYQRDNDSPFQNHHHGEGELVLLDLVSDMIYKGEDFFVKAFLVSNWPAILPETIFEVHSQVFSLLAFSFRGPPVELLYQHSKSTL